VLVPLTWASAPSFDFDLASEFRALHAIPVPRPPKTSQNTSD
jgi:hypothetical protein